MRHIYRNVPAAISYDIHIYLIARLVSGIEGEGMATHGISYEDEPRVSWIEDVLLNRLIAVRVSLDHCHRTALERASILNRAFNGHLIY